MLYLLIALKISKQNKTCNHFCHILHTCQPNYFQQKIWILSIVNGLFISIHALINLEKDWKFENKIYIYLKSNLKIWHQTQNQTWKQKSNLKTMKTMLYLFILVFVLKKKRVIIWPCFIEVTFNIYFWIQSIFNSLESCSQACLLWFSNESMLTNDLKPPW